MLKQIRLVNFYSFQDDTIYLEPDANLLIGINGAGKSNLLKALRLLYESFNGVGVYQHIYLNLGGFDNIFFKGRATGSSHKEIRLEFTFHGASVDNATFRDDLLYTVTLRKVDGSANISVSELLESLSENRNHFNYLDFTDGVGSALELKDKPDKRSHYRGDYALDPQQLALRQLNDPERYPYLNKVQKAIKEIIVYDYFDTTPKSLIRKPMLPTSGTRLAVDGSNLTQILNTLKINQKAVFRKIVEKIKKVNPYFTGFDFNFLGGNIELMLEEDDLNQSIHVSSISDGTLHFLCLLAILYNPNRGRVICIDEPEVGLHPNMIANLADAIKEASETSLIVISTHSPDLLNHFELGQIIVLEKDTNNATISTYPTIEQFQDWYDKFAPGRMWINGDFGGLYNGKAQ